MLLGVFLSTTESYMMITNMLSTKNLQEQKTYFNEKYTGGNDFPHDLI